MASARAFKPLALTHKYRGIIDALIVGNEVLLRQDLEPEALAAHLKDAKARSAVPITYADVWEFWRRQASLAQYVDIVTIHVLPYWEDEPVAASAAAAHVFDTVRDMQAEFAGKPIWLGETGWPAAGRQRAGAVPGVVQQTQVLREIIQRAAAQSLDVNLIEAFDQPWKRNLEGGMGSAWGLFRADGSLRMSFEGPVREDAYWWRGVAGALIGALLGLGLSLRSSRGGGRPSHLRHMLGFAIIGCVAPAHLDAMYLWSRDAHEWAVAIGATTFVLAGSLSLLWQHSASSALSIAAKKFFCLGLLLTATAWAWYLWVDPRYRGFPIALFYPAGVFSLALTLGATAPRWQGLQALGAALLSIGLAYCAVEVVKNEELSNTQAVVIGTLWILIALAQVLACYPRRPAVLK
jgi:hypothetical protein